MSALVESNLLAIDVGNCQVKFGWYPPETACTSESKLGGLPIASSLLVQPEAMLACAHAGVSRDRFAAQVDEWLDRLPIQGGSCMVASVHVDAAVWVREILTRRGVVHPQVLCVADLPLEVRVEEPERVGIDRLLSAVAANRLRERDRPAIVVSLGTACTVNLIAADGAFEGGAIFPGIAMSAAALRSGTSALPLIGAELIEAPADGIGKSTEAAISSGLIWGLVGAVRELVERMTQASEGPPQLLLTGGDGPKLAEKISAVGARVQHVPNMVLAGIHAAAKEMH